MSDVSLQFGSITVFLVVIESKIESPLRIQNAVKKKVTVQIVKDK